MGEFQNLKESTTDLTVSFEYQCDTQQNTSSSSDSLHSFESSTTRILRTSSSFTCLSGAAISANFTLANTNICNGLIADEILPELDSPNSFRRLISSPSLSRLDLLLVSSPSRNSPSEITYNDGGLFEISRNNPWRSSNSPPTDIERENSSNFLNFIDVHTAGGAAGEDRVQAVCSEKNGFLFCGIYDGFNGRDAADFLAGTLYDNIAYYLYSLEIRIKQQQNSKQSGVQSGLTLTINMPEEDDELSEEAFKSFRSGVVGCLVSALEQAENDFLCMVEKEMEERPDLVSVGSCALIVLLHGSDLYVLNLGDSRAVLATVDNNDGALRAVQLTETHNVDDEFECKKLLGEHIDDPHVVSFGKIKGKLKVTRAIGVGYLKKRMFNDALMGILRVRNLISPPYVHTNPHTLIHNVSDHDLFIVLGSDGLFDFFTNEEVVTLVHDFIKDTPFSDPAKFLIDQLVFKAAEKAGFTKEELTNIPAGRRRKYHDDVTVIVILLGNKQRTLTASTSI